MTPQSKHILLFFALGAGVNNCFACDPGQYQATYGIHSPIFICEDCSPGKYSPTGDSCESCEPGHYQNQHGSASCVPCIADTYSTGIATIICYPCPVGESSSPGSASCSIAGGTCFHGSTLVALGDNTNKAMTELQVGDKIQTADINGNLDFAPILSLPHKAGNVEMATFLKIDTDAGKSVRMTPGHLMPNCAGKMLSANEVVVGDCLMTVDGKETVSKINSATDFGVYTAVTAHALIVADGIIASPFSVENDPRHYKDKDGTASFLINFFNLFFAEKSTGLLRRGAKEPE